MAVNLGRAKKRKDDAMRSRLADKIDDLLNVAGATTVTLALDANAARRLASDLRWCDRSRGPDTGYSAVLTGAVSAAPTDTKG